MKICLRCGEGKPVEKFSRLRGRDGWHWWCNECKAEAAALSAKRKNERMSNRRVNDAEFRERERERVATWRAANPDKVAMQNWSTSARRTVARLEQETS